MAIKLITGATCACLAALSLNVNATVLTFDDVPNGSVQNSKGDISAYQGFNFAPKFDWVDLVGSPSWDFGAHSGDFAILNSFGDFGIVTKTNGADFIFDGLWAKRWSTDPESAGPEVIFGTLSGYNNGKRVWDVAEQNGGSPVGLNGSYKFFGSQLGLIDELRIDFIGSFLIDDLAVAAVPVPAAVWLFGSGLFGLMMMFRRNPGTSQ